MMILLLLLLTVFITFKILMTSRYHYWKSKCFPYLEPSFPFGNLGKMCKGKQFLGEAYKEIYDKFKGQKFVGIFHYFTPVLMLRDPEEIKNVLTKDFEYFSSRDENPDTNFDVISMNLFHMQDREEWKFLRSKLTKTFSSSRMRQMFNELLRCSETMIQKLNQNYEESVEIKTITSDYTTQVSFSCFFGLEANGKNLNDVREAVAIPRFETLLRVSLYNVSSKLPNSFGIRLMPKFVADFFMELVKETLKYRENSGITRKDMFEELLQTKRKSEEESSEEEGNGKPKGSWKMGIDKIAAQCFLFYAASYDSSSFTMSACLRALAVHPDIQDKVIDEIDRVLEKYDGQMTYEAVQEMTYLEQVISETLRITPAVPELMRKCCKAYKTSDGLVVEPGVRIIIPVYSIHRDPEHYPEPERFDPERFSPENIKKRKQYTYLPFGEGPRSCLGMRFGILQTKIGLARILREFRVEPDPKHTEFPIAFSPKMFVVSVSRDGFWVKVSRRKYIPDH